MNQSILFHFTSSIKFTKLQIRETNLKKLKLIDFALSLPQSKNSLVHPIPSLLQPLHLSRRNCFFIGHKALGKLVQIIGHFNKNCMELFTLGNVFKWFYKSSGLNFFDFLASKLKFNVIIDWPSRWFKRYLPFLQLFL